MASSTARTGRSRVFTFLSEFVKTGSLISVRQSPGQRSRGLLRFRGHCFPCALGKGGISARKREGDGATPRGRFPLRRVWLRPDGRLRRAGGLSVHLTAPGDGWCDDPRHHRYNRPVRLPFEASHERMWRDDHLYDIVIEIGWNDAPAIKGRGSAIFMHVARPGYAATEGCVALTRRHLLQLLPHLDSTTRIDIR